jgi:hypothetical protein
VNSGFRFLRVFHIGAQPPQPTAGGDERQAHSTSPNESGCSTRLLSASVGPRLGSGTIAGPAFVGWHPPDQVGERLGRADRAHLGFVDFFTIETQASGS